MSLICFLAMIYFTLQMFLNQNIMRKRANWDLIFQLFSDAAAAISAKEMTTDQIDSVNNTEQKQKDQFLSSKNKQNENDSENETEYFNFNSNFTTVSWEPYINFFTALFFFLFSIGVSEKIVPNSILFCGISLFFAVFCFFGLADKTNIHALVAMGLNFFSWLVLFQYNY